MQAYQCHYQDYGVFDKCVHFVLMVDLPGIAPGSTMPSLGRDYNNKTIYRVLSAGFDLVVIALGQSAHHIHSRSEVFLGSDIVKLGSQHICHV